MIICNQCGLELPDKKNIICLCGTACSASDLNIQALADHSYKAKVLIDTRGREKAAICRTGVCGMYNVETDTCKVLTDKKMRGAIDWLYTHPDKHCVHPTEPQF